MASAASRGHEDPARQKNRSRRVAAGVPSYPRWCSLSVPLDHSLLRRRGHVVERGTGRDERLALEARLERAHELVEVLGRPAVDVRQGEWLALFRVDGEVDDPWG